MKQAAAHDDVVQLDSNVLQTRSFDEDLHHLRLVGAATLLEDQADHVIDVIDEVLLELLS